MRKKNQGVKSVRAVNPNRGPAITLPTRRKTRHGKRVKD